MLLLAAWKSLGACCLPLPHNTNTAAKAEVLIAEGGWRGEGGRCVCTIFLDTCNELLGAE